MSVDNIAVMKTTRRIKLAASLTLAVVLASTFTLSYSGLALIASRAGFVGFTAFVFPIAVDGMMLLGSFFSMSGRASIKAKLVVVLGVSISIVGNIASAAHIGPLAAFHAVPPVVFLLSMLLFEDLVSKKAAIEEAEYKAELKRQEAAARRAAAATTAANSSQSVPSSTKAVTGPQSAAQPRTLTAVTPVNTASTANAASKPQSKTQMIEDYLREHPEATPSTVARDLGFGEGRSVSTLVYRVKKRLSEEAAAA